MDGLNLLVVLKCLLMGWKWLVDVAEVLPNRTEMTFGGMPRSRL